jgi:hypothetical protein
MPAGSPQFDLLLHCPNDRESSRSLGSRGCNASSKSECRSDQFVTDHIDITRAICKRPGNSAHPMQAATGQSTRLQFSAQQSSGRIIQWSEPLQIVARQMGIEKALSLDRPLPTDPHAFTNDCRRLGWFHSEQFIDARSTNENPHIEAIE